MQNNRSLADNRFDEMDHALGRPNDPLGETSRNFFGVEIGCDKAEGLKSDPFWRHTRDFAGTSGFAVSERGKKALAGYLQANWTRPKSYDVTWCGFTRNVIAEKPSQAKYRAWMEADFSDLPFSEYIKTATARVA